MSPPEKCHHCGAAEQSYQPSDAETIYDCASWEGLSKHQSDLCRERSARQKEEKEAELYKRSLIETIEACEPLRNIKGLVLGQRINVEGVKLMIAENQKLRELCVEALAIEPHRLSGLEKQKEIRERLAQLT